MVYPWHQYVFALIFILAGLNHFRVPRMYMKIIPPFFGNKKFWNLIVGVGELLLGIGLMIPQTSVYSAWGIIVLLLAIFPSNVYMYTHEEASLRVAKWIRFVRLPLQFILIAWAWVYAGAF